MLEKIDKIFKKINWKSALMKASIGELTKRLTKSTYGNANVERIKDKNAAYIINQEWSITRNKGGQVH